MPIPILGLLGAFAAVAGVQASLSGNESENSSKDDEECTVAEAADLLGLSEYTVKKKIREKELVGRIVGKKYMVSLASIQEYSKRVGKSGQVLGESSLDSPGISEEVWNNPTSLQALVETTKLQQEILSIECKKLELTKKRAIKAADDDQVDELSLQIMDKEIQGRELSKWIKLCEAQILVLKENENGKTIGENSLNE